jgi:hypothetical protein
MHVLDYILDRLSGLFRFNRYSLVEKAYSVLFHVVGRGMLERLHVVARPYEVKTQNKEVQGY